MRLYILTLALALIAASPDDSPTSDSTSKKIVLDDFEKDSGGKWPKKWRYLAASDKSFMPLKGVMDEKEKFYVVAENGNKFVRAYTEGEAQRISLPPSTMNWRLSEHPILSWEWRARQLPAGANERNVNDTGGAVYVSFSQTDWLGRPLSIKYTYSTTLPVGTVVSTGNVKIIVASSGTDGIGRWTGVERNVVDDYKQLFGQAPTEDPFTITLWSDSDDTKSVGEVDFDNLTVRPSRK